jgi:RNA polymerase primary sigma factor
MEPPGGSGRQALDSYLAEVAAEHTLTPSEEVSRAHELAGRRTAYWEALLSHPPYVEPVSAFVERQLKIDDAAPGHAEALEDLRVRARALRHRHTRDNRDRFATAASAVAHTWAKAEPEPATADLVRSELERVATGHITGARIPLRCPPAGSRPFAAYRERVERARRDYAQAKEAFVRANLRLVIATAKHYNHGILSLTDLIQEGNIGLMKAVDRFDPDRGTRFSTFAVWWIRHKITRAMANHGRTIRLPVHVTVDNMNLRKADKQLRTELGREPSEEELANVVQMSVERIRLTRRAVRARPVSTAAPLKSEGTTCIQDLLACEGTEDDFEHVEAAADCERLRAAMASLSEMERDILRRRFGLSNGEEHTLAEIGKLYELSRERIRQLQNRALSRLRGELDDRAPAA